MQWANGNWYDGQWEDGRASGYGEYHWNNKYGTVYQGFWKKDLRHGEGKMSWTKGPLQQDTYEGQFVEGKMHGYVVHTFKNGYKFYG